MTTIEQPEDGPVVFSRSRPNRRRLPLAIDQSTLGVILIVWALVSIANAAASIQLIVLTPAPRGLPDPLLRMLQATPFPWLWYWFVGPSCVIAFSALVTAGAALMAKRRSPGRAITATGLLLALGADLVTVAVEATSLGGPFHMPWQWLVATSASTVLWLGALYLVAAAGGPSLTLGGPAALEAPARPEAPNP